MRAALAASLLLAAPAFAHDGIAHTSVAEARNHSAETSSLPLGSDTALPLNIGGAFALRDDTGALRTQVNPDGGLQLLFFGYANCQAICSVSLPLMGEIAERVGDAGVRLTPVMVTVDPVRDKVGTMTAPLSQHHPDFVGLTGSQTELDVAYRAFSIDRKFIFEDPEHGAVYAHGSLIYLLDGAGGLLTLIPPILSPERAAQIVLSYAAQ